MTQQRQQPAKVLRSKHTEDESIDSLNYGEDNASKRQPQPQRRAAQGRVTTNNNKRSEAPRAGKDGHMVLPWNDVTVSGNLGRDPELKVTSDGIPYTKFSLAVYTGKDRDGNYNPPIWMNITFWRDLAEEVEQSVSKGDHVLVKGQLNQWTNDNGVVWTGITADYIEIGWPEGK